MIAYATTLLVSTIVTAALPPQTVPATASTTLNMQVEVTPGHGLPGIPPAFKITLDNPVQDPVKVYCASFGFNVVRSDGSSFSVGCDGTAGCSNFCKSPLSLNPTLHDGAVVVAGGAKSVLYVDFESNTQFLDTRLLLPGTYKIRIIGAASAGGFVSNEFIYTVDDPQGDNRLVWNLLLDGNEQARYIPFSRADVQQALAAHPGCDYSRAWAYYLDLLNDEKTAGSREALQRYVASGVPESLDMEFRLSIAAAYRSEAKDFALQGKLTEAENALATGLGILQTLAANKSSYAAGAAAVLLKQPLWTRQELVKFADQVHGVNQPPLKPIEPRVNCVRLNSDGTFTVVFGYVNPNKGVLYFAVGPKNTFEMAPAQRGQPTNFMLGEHNDVFRVTAPAGEKMVWIVDGHRATASANEGSPRCDTPAGQSAGH